MQLELGLFDRKIYLIALELSQPFTIDDWTSAVQTKHPTWTKKNVQNRVKNMLRQNLLSKHRKGFKSYYSCLVTRDEFLAAEFISHKTPDGNNNFFMCGL